MVNLKTVLFFSKAYIISLKQLSSDKTIIILIEKEKYFLFWFREISFSHTSSDPSHIPWSF